jgi:hypothetical protein
MAITTTSRMYHNCLGILCFLWTVSAQSCYDNFYDIYDEESIVTDTTFPRQYIICPRTTYKMATLDFMGNVNEDPTSGINPPLPLRPNMTLRCGDGGSKDNECWISGGDLHMDGTATRDINDATLEGVTIEGFVFIGARKHSLWATKPGSITFRDCEWKVCRPLMSL